MIKLIFCLLLLTTISLAQNDKSDDEIDLKTNKPAVDKDSPKSEESPLPKSDETVPKNDENVAKNDENVPKTDENVPKTDGKNPINNENDVKNENPLENPGIDKPNNVGEEDKVTKKVEKPLESEPDIDLGKDFKKVSIKPENRDKNSDRDYDQSGGGNEDKFGEPDVKSGGEGGGGGHVKNEESLPAPDSKLSPEKEVKIGNEITDNLIKLMKTDYRSDFESVKLGQFEPFKHGRWGSVVLHSGVVTGLTNIERLGNVVVVDEFGNKKLLIADIAVKDVYADYKMNAKLFHRISFKDRDLKLWLKKAVLNVKLEIDKNDKKLIVKELNVKSMEGFTVKSGRLFWPFNKLTNAIVKNQEHVIKDLIKKEFDKYMGKVVHTIQFDSVFAKLF